MRFGFTDEQEQFRAEVRRFLRARSPIAEVRRQMTSASGFDAAVWRQLHTDIGLLGLHLPVELGGHGFGFVELGLTLEEMGRALLCAPYFGSAVLAAQAILNGATAAEQGELLPAIATGERIATLAWVEAAGRWDADGIALTAAPSGDRFLLEGAKRFVLDGDVADCLIVAARTPGTTGTDGVSLFVVDAPCSGLERRHLRTIDATRRQAALRFDSVLARRLGEAGSGAAALARTLDEAAVALACEMIGGASAMLDSAVDYARIRMQFGRPIGSFQAIKHKCADMLLELELASAAARQAAAAVAAGDAEVPALASLAKACAGDAYMRIAAECIQIHGGIGFTWEHDAHLWFRRAKSSEVMLGDACHHRERYLAMLDAAA